MSLYFSEMEHNTPISLYHKILDIKGSNEHSLPETGMQSSRHFWLIWYSTERGFDIMLCQCHWHRRHHWFEQRNFIFDTNMHVHVYPLVKAHQL